MTLLHRAAAPLLLAALLAVPVPATAQDDPPTTEFEDNGGADWTSFDGEQAFLAEVDARSERVSTVEVGRTLGDRPIHLVTLGEPAPRTREEILAEPSAYFVCSVHGNEPAGREACLIAIRDLASTDDPALLELLGATTLLFTPTTNPDGRAANSRGNSLGTDVNRDHLNLETEEAQAVAQVIRDFQPDATVDLHEYGPSEPVVYDDDVLVLWPRNLNVDREVYELAVSLAQDWIAAGVEEAGYTADEYGLLEVGGQDVTQTAGDEDEGILRNQGGLRHSLGILVETAVSPRLLNPPDPTEVDPAANMRRRVGGHRQVITEVLAFMAGEGTAAMDVTAGARERKAAEGRDQSAPLYLGGQEQDSTIDGSGPGATPEETIDPPPCAYRLTSGQLETVQRTLDLQGVEVVNDPAGGDAFVPLGQPAEPVISLLLDSRGRRTAFPDTADSPQPLDTCADVPAPQPAITVDRVAGSGRVETAVAVAEAVGRAPDTVVVATAADYADALAATPLAAHLGATLLLSEPARLSAATAEAVAADGFTDAVVIGGERALSPDVVADLEGLGLAVRRIGGSSRFETAGLVFDELGRRDTVAVVEGEHEEPSRGWPDALSGGALAASALGASAPHEAPEGLLLVNRDRLPEETRERLRDDLDVVLVGGESAVSPEVAEEVDAAALGVERLAGATRYATSAQAADAALAVPRSCGNLDGGPCIGDVVWLATGRDWPDGLVSGATGEIVLLIDGADPAGSPDAYAWLQAHAADLRTVHLAGGPDAISPAVEQAVRDAIGLG